MIKLKQLTYLVGIGLALCVQTVSAQTCRDNILPSTPRSDFIDHNDGTVTHKTTGLMWKKCSEGVSGEYCTIGSPSVATWSQALQNANTSEFAGYSDWRIPNVKELSSIAENKCERPTINREVFPYFPENASYWTSTPSQRNSDYVWRIYFYEGDDKKESKKSDEWKSILVRTSG